MSSDTIQFKILAESNVQPATNRITLPDEVFEHDILLHPSDLPDEPENEDAVGFAHWYYDKKYGWPILSDRPLSTITIKPGESEFGENKEQVRYGYPYNKNRFYDQQGEKGVWTVTIPKKFFAADTSNKDPQQTRVPEPVQFEYGEDRYFVTTEKALSDEPNEVKSCFVLREQTVNQIMSYGVDEDSEGFAPEFGF